MHSDLICTPDESNTEYFTRAAAYIRDLKETKPEREVSDAMKAINEYLIPLIMHHVDCEIKSNHLDENTGIVYGNMVLDVIEKNFHKYNSPKYLSEKKQDKCFEITTFIKSISRHCIRDAIAYNLHLTKNEGKKLYEIRCARHKLSEKYQINESSVKVEQIYESLDKKIPEKIIIDLLMKEKGTASLEAIEANGSTAGYYEININQFYSEIDATTKQKLDQFLDNITGMELLIYLHANKLLDDELNNLSIVDFVQTEIFKTHFNNDTSIRSRKNPVRTVHNKRAKTNAVFLHLKDLVAETDLRSEDKELFRQYLKNRLFNKK